MILYQVNRALSKKNFLNHFRRFIHSENVLYPLESRKLLRISGNDAGIFLQGLITNDMRHFEEGATSMYAMFLNNKGRVLYDTLIHKWDNGDSFMIECDKKVISLLQKHLKLYKLKRLVEINDVNRDFKLWAFISPPESVPETKIDPKNKINIYKDPRLVHLGFRIITSECVDNNKILETIGKGVVIKPNDEGYKYLRYKLGVSEGAEDMPPGSSFPLEVNCDYLHGVSFHKGCYIGQELTARVHHTGVIRKRIMPLSFPEKVDDDLQIDSVISASDNPKSNLGKLKGFIQNYGIGLVRIKEALEAKALNIGKHSVEVLKPSWWPVEAPKEKATGIKIE